MLQAREDAGLRNPGSFLGGKEVTNSAGYHVQEGLGNESQSSRPWGKLGDSFIAGSGSKVACS